MTPLREIAAQGSRIVTSNVWLYRPGETIAARVGSMNGTPLPHEEPQELNPPAGVVIYYSLKTAARQPLKLELLDGAGVVHACAASDTPLRQVDTETLNVQAYWEQPAQPPSAGAGMHRVALGGATGRMGFGRGPVAPPPQDACAGSVVATASSERRETPTLQPGAYTVRLTVDGQTYTEPATVKPDPRGAPGQHP
jgi:hypothetical protein